MGSRVLNPNVKTVSDCRREFMKIRMIFSQFGRPPIPFVFNGNGNTDEIEVPFYVPDTNYVMYQNTFMCIPKTDQTESFGEFSKQTGVGYSYEQIQDSHGKYTLIKPVAANIFLPNRQCVFWYSPAEL